MATITSVRVAKASRLVTACPTRWGTWFTIAIVLAAKSTVHIVIGIVICSSLGPTCALGALLVTSGQGGGTVLEYNDSTGAYVGTFGPSSLGFQSGISSGPDGDVYVGWISNSPGLEHIEKLDPTGASLGTFAGGLSGIGNFTFGPDGNLYVASRSSVTSTDEITFFDGDTGASLGTFASYPVHTSPGPGIAFGPDGNLYAVGQNIGQVLQFDGVTGTFLGNFTPSGSGLNNPTEIVFGPDGNLYVSAASSNNVVRFNGLTGALIDEFVPSGLGGLDRAESLAFGPDGNLYVISRNTQSVLRYDGSSGAFMDVFVSAGSGGLDYPNDLMFTAVPEPSTLVIALMAAVGLCAFRRQRRRA